MSYKIECTIQEIEISLDGKVTGLKIKGTEGYLLKQGDGEYNVFSPDTMPQKDGSGVNAFVLHAEMELNINGVVGGDLFSVLIQAKSAGRKIKLEINADTGTVREGFAPKAVKLTSISVL
ncbi:hypothetical protein [Fibrobacter sp.]|uniref:hypothetical protein n=1 Tax=Fibrobacter sp. TaxID=35828 RepID=UPI00388DF6D0